MSSPAAVTDIAAIEARLAEGDEAFRSSKLHGVSTPSLTRAAGAAYLVTDAGLLQLGGSPAFAGPIWRDGHHYLYAFTPRDRENIARFAGEIDRAFLPRPQQARPAIAAGNRHPEISLPAVFDAFESIFEQTGRNLASTVQLSATREMTTDEEIAARDGANPTAPGHTRVSIGHLYHAGLWAAIRSGYRRGYNAEADHFIVSGADDRAIAKSVEWVKEAIRQAAGYTKFTTDTSRVFDLRADPRHPEPYSESQIEDLFAARRTPEEQSWVHHAFGKPFACDHREYRFTTPEIKRLAVKFGPSLKLNEDLFDAITRAKNGQPFDFEPSLDEADTLTTPRELIFYMHWLRERGRPAQLVPPNLGFKKRQAYPETPEALARYTHHKMWPELAGVSDPVPELQRRVAELAGVARYFDGTLSIHSGSGKQPAVLASIGEATRGRLNYKISGELQLQLFDVLAGQPENSPERRLFLRMVAACEKFAAANAFGEESALAEPYHSSHGASLGDASRGRVDGNLFLVFWLGNMVGCRDEDGVFFKEKLDHLPAAVIQETRTRNASYVRWLAANLFTNV